MLATLNGIISAYELSKSTPAQSSAPVLRISGYDFLACGSQKIEPEDDPYKLFIRDITSARDTILNAPAQMKQREDELANKKKSILERREKILAELKDKYTKGEKKIARNRRFFVSFVADRWGR